MTNNVLSGIFLSFNDRECRAIWEAVTAEGHPESIDGLKEWILERVAEGSEEEPQGPTDRVLKSVEEYLRGHPEEVSRFTYLGKAAIKDMIRRFSR